MSSKADIFDRVSEAKPDIFDRVSTKKEPKFGSFFDRKERRPGGVAGAVAENPLQALAEAAISGTTGFLESGGPLGGTFPTGSPLEKLSRVPGLSPENGPSEVLREKAGITDLPPEEREELEVFSGLVNLFGPILAGKVISGIKNFKPSPAKPPGAKPLLPASESVFPKAEEPTSTSKITEDLKAAGKQAKEGLLGPNISKKIPESISKERIKNTTHAGEELEKSVGSAYDEISARINKAYNKSRSLNKNIEAIHPELEADLLKSIEELEKIPDPSSPMKRFIESSKKVAKDLAERDANGSIVGYKPISNQVLIDQIQEYNSIPNFDFPSDTKTGIFKTLINKLTSAVDSTAAKHPEAIKSWQEAKNLYSEKSNLFSDPDVAKWTKLSEKNYSKDFRSSIDIDKIRKLKPVLEKTAEGKAILQKMKRELVREKLDKYTTVSNRFKTEEIAEELAELEVVLSKDEIAEIKRLIEESRTLPAKAISIADKFYKFLRRPTRMLHEAEKIK